MHQDLLCGHLRTGGSAALFWPWMSKQNPLDDEVNKALFACCWNGHATEPKTQHEIDIIKIYIISKAWDLGQVMDIHGANGECQHNVSGSHCIASLGTPLN